jgi:succinate dehydrogenase/fumarate reductase-like Fe-S protein
MLSGRALAVVVLARSLLRVAIGRLFRERTGLPLFHDNYDGDRLPPVSADDRERFATFSRCIACGRCDVGESERMVASNGAYPGLMAVVMASSRSMPDFDAAARALAFVPDEVLAAKTRVCPTRVPFLDLARFVRITSQRMLLDAPLRPSLTTGAKRLPA